MRDTVSKIMQDVAVQHAYSVTGESDIILILALQNIPEYQQICDRLFNFDANVVRFFTRFVMQAYR